MSRRTLATYKLQFPIIRETRDQSGEEHEEVLREAGFCVVLKRPRGKDMKILDKYEGQDVTGSLALLGRISNLTDEECDLLDMVDVEALGNLLTKASPPGRTTGETA